MKYKEHSETWRRNGLADLKYKVLDRVPLAKGTEKVRYSKQTTVACCVEAFYATVLYSVLRGTFVVSPGWCVISLRMNR